MAKIVITEIDETLPASVAESTDIVYVPGFADTNQNCYIVNSSSGAPTNDLPGSVVTVAPTVIDFNSHNAYPEFYINTLNRKVWYCSASSGSAYTWTSADSLYKDPYPENEPILCGSVADFVSAFGDSPYKFVKEVGEGDNTGVSGRIAFPKVNGVDYVQYSIGDYERSYIYARELVALGLPVLYENCAKRDDDGKKSYPTVTDLYASIKGMLQNISDLGEYTVKYITSGAYPNYDEVCVVESHKATSAEASAKGFALGGFYTVESVSIGSTYYSVLSTGSAVADESVVVSAGTVTFADGDTNFVANAVVNVWAPVAVEMSKSAATRGDAVALVDHTNVPGRDLTGDDSVFGSVNDSGSIFKTAVAYGGAKEYAPYATIMTPWAFYNVPNEIPSVASTKQVMPASFGYLLSLAKSIKTNANWFAVAGVARGVVPNIVAAKLTNSIADGYQGRTGIAINAITNIKPYGLTIWGNRTLLDNTTNLSAHSFLNTRNMVNDVKKVAYTTAKSLMFEQNSEQLWLSFKAGIMPILNQMQSGQGITAYKILREESDEPAKLVAKIKLYPIYAVEDFKINFEISVVVTNEAVTVQ